ncbi:WDR59 [Bugula neritina]|uniref:WDR59 n=1 Tax=Bugula neritina TaxID=10212 RepID=A0A7J7JKK2_BUGNE|nr:WDR59 [Bugula neritina]
MASNAVNFLIGNVLGEFKDSPRSVMTLDSTGDLVLLASKHVLNIVNISSPYVGDSSNLPYNSCKYPNKNVKWEVKAAQWNPHKTESSVFVITKNHVADIFVHVNGKVKLLSTLQSHTRAITDLDWSVHDSNLLLTCSSDGNAFLWDKRQLGPVQLFETLQSCSSSQVKWNKLEEHIFATSHDRDIRIWDGRKTDRPIYISGHLKKIHGLDWSTHNSKLLASASEDETVKFGTTPSQPSITTSAN